MSPQCLRFKLWRMLLVRMAHAQVRSEELAAQCPRVLRGLEDVQRSFAEAMSKKLALRADFRSKFRNISRIMDCVGCEKCRLWGKVEFLGLGTAMKVRCKHWCVGLGRCL